MKLLFFSFGMPFFWLSCHCYLKMIYVIKNTFHISLMSWKGKRNPPVPYLIYNFIIEKRINGINLLYKQFHQKTQWNRIPFLRMRVKRPFYPSSFLFFFLLPSLFFFYHFKINKVVITVTAR